MSPYTNDDVTYKKREAGFEMNPATSTLKCTCMKVTVISNNLDDLGYDMVTGESL